MESWFLSVWAPLHETSVSYKAEMAFDRELKYRVKTLLLALVPGTSTLDIKSLATVH